MQAGARLESFKVVQIADANHVEVQQFLGKIRETLAAFQGYIFRSHLNKAPVRSTNAAFLADKSPKCLKTSSLKF